MDAYSGSSAAAAASVNDPSVGQRSTSNDEERFRRTSDLVLTFDSGRTDIPSRRPQCSRIRWASVMLRSGFCADSDPGAALVPKTVTVSRIWSSSPTPGCCRRGTWTPSKTPDSPSSWAPGSARPRTTWPRPHHARQRAPRWGDSRIETGHGRRGERAGTAGGLLSIRTLERH